MGYFSCFLNWEIDVIWENDCIEIICRDECKFPSFDFLVEWSAIQKFAPFLDYLFVSVLASMWP